MGFRNLRKNKDFGFLNIAGLAIGIACSGLIFLWLADELSWDGNNVKKDRLAAVRINVKIGDGLFSSPSTPRAMAAAILREIPGIANTCRVSYGETNLLVRIGDRSVYAMGRYVDSPVFSMFTLPFVQGGPATAFRQLYSLVVTETAAKKWFGEDFGPGKSIIGRRVNLDNRQDFVIAGVVKDPPENSTLQFEWLAPFRVTIAEEEAKGYFDDVSWEGYGPETYVELAPGASMAAINMRILNFIHTKRPASNDHSSLLPMRDWHLRDAFSDGKQTGGGRIEQVRLLSFIAWIILMIACINFMNLATARSDRRSKEVGVRKVLGAARSGLVLRFLSEALLMAGMAAVLAVGIIALALPAFNQLVGKQLTMHAGDPLYLLGLLAITVICGLVAGSYPSLYLSSFRPIRVLKGIQAKGGGTGLIRKGLVVFQFAVSLIFMISTAVVYLQMQHIGKRDLGFRRDNLLEINLEHTMAGEFPLIRQHLLSTGMVEDATMTDHRIIEGGNSDDFKWPGKDPNAKSNIAFRKVSPSFIQTTGMRIVDGRDFDDHSDSSHPEVLINEAFARMMGDESPVGKIIQSPRDQPRGHYRDVRVRGVVANYVYGDLYGQAQPLIIFCQPPEWEYLVYVRIKPSADIGRAYAGIQAVLKKDNPIFPFEGKFVDDQFNNRFADERQTSRLSGLFATLAVIISCLGLFGLAAFSAERRRKEIGIRKVLGASVYGITGLLSLDFIRLVLIACLIAFPVAWMIMHDWLRNYEYRIGIRWWVFAVTGGIALFIAWLTIGYHAIKAAVANPVRTLRTE